MGCCLSIDDKIPSPPPPPPPPPPSSFPKSSRDPPPPPPPWDDEETVVKEVLSETPIPKPYLLPKTQDEPKKLIPKHTLHEIRSPVKNNDVKKPISINPNPTAEEVSEEASEICSTTLSESVSTTTFSEKRDNGVNGDARQRSPAKYRNNNRSGSGELRRERVVGKSPARGLNQSPGRVRSVNGRVVAAQGESSVPGLRSRSPANRTGGVRNSPSVRKTGTSPSRVEADLNRRNVEDKWGEPTTTNESLENPLVSLECFIFL